MPSPWASRRGDRGTVTAEFAAVIPAVVVVLALCLGAVQLSGQHVRLTYAAAQAARSLARGDGPDRATALARQAVSGASVAVEHRGELVCARLSVRGSLGFTLTAGSCSLGGSP
jgi:Flp pilus assembly protein TadG